MWISQSHGWTIAPSDAEVALHRAPLKVPLSSDQIQSISIRIDQKIIQNQLFSNKLVEIQLSSARASCRCRRPWAALVWPRPWVVRRAPCRAPRRQAPARRPRGHQHRVPHRACLACQHREHRELGGAPKSWMFQGFSKKFHEFHGFFKIMSWGWTQMPWQLRCRRWWEAWEAGLSGWFSRLLKKLEVCTKVYITHFGSWALIMIKLHFSFFSFFFFQGLIFEECLAHELMHLRTRKMYCQIDVVCLVSCTCSRTSSRGMPGLGGGMGAPPGGAAADGRLLVGRICTQHGNISEHLIAPKSNQESSRGFTQPKLE